jgi:multidrug efflux pump subunit AcrB
VHHQGKPVIALGVSMAKGGDIIALGKALEEATHRIEKTMPVGVSLLQVQDQPKAVQKSVGEFVKVLIEAVLIVLLVSFVALGLHKGGRYGWYVDMRPGWVVAITIPLVLSMTFLAMNYWALACTKFPSVRSSLRWACWWTMPSLPWR